MKQTLWRAGVYKRLKELAPGGSVLDLGGAKQADYHALLGKEARVTVANIDAAYGFDIYCDLEKPFPVHGESFDVVLALNILEHVFDYRNVLAESHRVLKNNGTLILAVPFLLQIHPCPHDYWRFSKDALERIVAAAGFQHIRIESIGTGIFSATHQLHYGLYHFSLLRSLARAWHMFLDLILKSWGGVSYGKDRYPLGYFVTAERRITTSL
jgi:SAM-dependent methyltransferase